MNQVRYKMDPKIGKAIFIYIILTICLVCIVYQSMDLCGCFNKCKDHDNNCRTCTCSCSCRRKRSQKIVVVQAEAIEIP